jgi:hypothetical protein
MRAAGGSRQSRLGDVKLHFASSTNLSSVMTTSVRDLSPISSLSRPFGAVSVAQAIFFRRRHRHQPRRPPLATIRSGLGQRDYGA